MSRNWGMGSEPDTLPQPTQALEEGEDDGGAFHDCNPPPRTQRQRWIDRAVFVALMAAALSLLKCG